MRFKSWLKISENLAGPGGGTEWKKKDPEAIPKDDAKHGVGAFPTYGDDLPPKKGKSPIKKYIFPKSNRKFSKK